MESTKKNLVKEKAPFAQRYPITNFMIGLALLVILVLVVILLIWFIFSCLGNGIEHLVDFLKKFVSTTDKVILGREKRIPFEVAVDPFYSQENMNRLKESVAQMEAAGGTVHELDFDD